jgi:hypothetical protein
MSIMNSFINIFEELVCEAAPLQQANHHLLGDPDLYLPHPSSRCL